MRYLFQPFDVPAFVSVPNAGLAPIAGAAGWSAMM